MKYIKRIFQIILTIILVFILLYFLLPNESINYFYISAKGLKTKITIIQYLNFKEDGKDGYYIMHGDVPEKKSLPESNYIKMELQTDPLWINIKKGGNVHILYSLGDVLENKLKQDNIIIEQFYSEEEFNEIVGEKKYNYQLVWLNSLE